MFDLFPIHIAYAVDDVETLIGKFNQLILNPLIDMMFVVAFAFFLYGVFEFIVGGSKNAEKKTKGKSHMFWGIIGMVIMFSVFGIIKFIMTTIGAK